MTHERYVTYDNRASSFYAPYSSYHSPYVYHDNFSPFLMGWLMSDALNSSSRAQWVYNHRDSNELLKHDAKLAAELEAIKARNVAPDPNYVPKEFADNPDLMYAKDAVAVGDPVAIPVSGPAPRVSQPQSQGWSFLGTVGLLFVICVVGGVIYYVCCVKEFK